MVRLVFRQDWPVRRRRPLLYAGFSILRGFARIGDEMSRS